MTGSSSASAMRPNMRPSAGLASRFGCLIQTDPLPKGASGSFHLGSAQGSTNNRLNPAAGAIDLRTAVDPEAIGYAFEDRFQISAVALFPRCRAVQRALRARHRRNESLAFRHDWPPCPMLCRPRQSPKTDRSRQDESRPGLVRRQYLHEIFLIWKAVTSKLRRHGRRK